jgi:hypothetical protein
MFSIVNNVHYHHHFLLDRSAQWAQLDLGLTRGSIYGPHDSKHCRNDYLPLLSRSLSFLCVWQVEGLPELANGVFWGTYEWVSLRGLKEMSSIFADQ